MKNIMKYCIVISLLIFIYSCNKTSENAINNEKLNHIKITNKTLEETLDKFIVNANIYSVKKGKDILINLYVREDSDTIIQIINTPPYECLNIRGYANFKGYKLFFFWEDALDTEFKDRKIFITTKGQANSCESYIDSTYVDMPYEEFYILNEDQIYPM